MKHRSNHVSLFIGLFVVAGQTVACANLEDPSNDESSEDTISVTPNVAALAGATNLALNKAVTASSVETSSLPASAAVDGSASSRWASLASDAQWITVNLGAATTINHVVINWEAAYAKSYQIQTSTNGTTWSTVFSTTTGAGGTADIKFTAVSAKYVRMQGITRATQWGYSLYELQVFNDSTTPAAFVTIDQVIADMSSPSEVIPIDPRFNWQYNPEITMYAPRGDAIPSWWSGERPEWCYSVLSWFVVQEAQGNTATNARVQVKNIRFFIQSQATGQWSRIDTAEAPDVGLWKIPFDYASDDAGERLESSGGISVKPKAPLFHHGYGHGTWITPQDVRATFTAIDFRLTVDDPTKPDDRANAKYVVDTGADYYPGAVTVQWSLGYAPGVGNGRFLKATNSWRTATLLVPNTNYGSTFENIRTNPPPLN